MKKFFGLSLFLFISVVSLAQTGYYGSLRAVEFKVDVLPSLRKVHHFNEGQNLMSQRFRFAYLNYNLNFVRSYGRSVELSFGFEFSRMRACTQGYTYSADLNIYNQSGDVVSTFTDNGIFLNDPIINYYGIKGEWKHYKRGNKAPMGNYFGLSVQAGPAFLKDDIPVVVGKTGELLKDSPMGEKYDVVAHASVDRTGWRRMMLCGSLQAKFGRTFPINEFISLSGSVSIPIVSGYIADFIPIIDLLPVYGAHPVDIFELSGSTNISNSSDWYSLMSSTVKSYNGLGAEIGLRFHF